MPHIGGRPPLGDIGAESISVLRKLSFSSVRTITDPLNIPASMISIHLVEGLVLNFFVRWVPLTLINALRE
jgi:hypothetical protein